jgi:recombination protein RecR
MDNKKEDDLLISSLAKRVKNDSIDEIILALSTSVEGSTTAHYIQDALKDLDVKISKLAQGIPVGGEIEFLDDGTLFSAFKNRNSVS